MVVAAFLCLAFWLIGMAISAHRASQLTDWRSLGDRLRRRR